MRILFSVIAAATLLAAGSAFAGQTEGLIKKVDKDAMTLTLDDGTSYKLNAEMDVDSLKPGMDVVIAYDVTDGQNVITDMELPE
jgi:Cu/Ag efflux protein CusF